MRALALVVLASCTMFDTPDVGPILNPPVDGATNTETTLGCTDADSDPSTMVSFGNDIRPLMLMSPGGCSPCHLGRITSGLDLSSYASMRRGGMISGSNIIIPMEPCESILPGKLSPTPPFGSRMPFNGPPYFSAAQLQLVRDWIAEGALDN
ncbi:MAG TPA: hypothetical protein VGG74_29595 [Kofleriaceae bacterium]|jgi:hypothetical protein